MTSGTEIFDFAFEHYRIIREQLSFTVCWTEALIIKRLFTSYHESQLVRIWDNSAFYLDQNHGGILEIGTLIAELLNL